MNKFIKIHIENKNENKNIILEWGGLGLGNLSFFGDFWRTNKMQNKLKKEIYDM